ncbi:MAG: helix-turn-helix domain-containing protein [Thermoplasmata archaeon]|nr:helix-turn-helix domain-containing protein [Candidatus Sysuiplasma acidicola]
MTLRILKVELDLDTIKPLDKLLFRFFINNESIEVMQTLFASEKTMVEMVKIRRSLNFYTPGDIAMKRDELSKKYGLIDFELLEADETSGTYRVIIKHRTPPKLAPLLRDLGDSVFLASPLKIKSGKAPMTLFVDEQNMQKAVERLKEQHVKFSISSVGSVAGGKKRTGGMTPVQLSLVRMAHAMGYFEVPRKANTEDVAKMAGVTPPAVSKAIRRAERLLIEKMLEEMTTS